MLKNLITTLAFKNRIPGYTLTKNLKFFRVLKGKFHPCKMDSVSEAAKGWSNPGISNIYEKTRPNYNLDSVEFLLEKVGALKPRTDAEPFTIVELGAGTGKFTRAVLKVFEKHALRNYRIIATEPLKEMCDKFKEMVPDVEILQHAASDLRGLSSSLADIVLAAQCFHWFALDRKAIDEIHRVLKPKGALGLVWNLPDRSVSWIKNLEEMLDPRFKKMNVPRPQPPDYNSDVLLASLRNCGGFVNEGEDTSFKYNMELDLRAIIDRYEGNSVVSSAPDEEKQQLLLAVEQEMKTNPDVKDKQRYLYEFVVKMYWFTHED